MCHAAHGNLAKISSLIAQTKSDNTHLYTTHCTLQLHTTSAVLGPVLLSLHNKTENLISIAGLSCTLPFLSRKGRHSISRLETIIGETMIG